MAFRRMKFINDFNKKYMISNTGDVYSFHLNKKGKKLNTFIVKKYEYINLRKKEATSSLHSIHALVMASFGPPKPIGQNMVIHHKDLNNLNNDISNLEWIEYGEVIKLSWLVEGRRSGRKFRPVLLLKNNRPKFLYTSISQCTRETGVTKNFVYNYCNNKSKVGLYVWRWKEEYEKETNKKIIKKTDILDRVYYDADNL